MLEGFGHGAAGGAFGGHYEKIAVEFTMMN